MDNLGIQQIKTAPRSPDRNGEAERFVGTHRRELLDHLIVLGEQYLLRLVRSQASYYNVRRPYMALDRDAPVRRAGEPQRLGRVLAFAGVAGLHNRYA